MSKEMVNEIVKEAAAGAAVSAEVAPASSRLRTRLFAAAVLCAIVACLALVVRTVYYAVKDSYIAPAILSPDSDLVLSSRLKLGELSVERERCEAELEGLQEELKADEAAIERLRDVSRTAASAIQWASRVSSDRTSTGGAELNALAQKAGLLERMIKDQKTLVSRAQVAFDSRLVTRSQLAKETQALHELEVALLENQRVTVQSARSRAEASLTTRGALEGGDGPVAPEVAMRKEQMIRVELELARLGAEIRAKKAQQRALKDRLSRIVELAAQMQSRPLFQAVERKLNIAFVPYTQIDGVVPGAEVLSCVWGIFACKSVGVVAAVMPGEVVLPDPWGNQARGQYAVLTLRDEEAARDKVLRVRRGSAARAQGSAPSKG